MTSERDEGVFWSALTGSVLHPVQLQIIEAMRWIDLPLSASQLVQVFDEEEPLSQVSYHVRALAARGAAKVVSQRAVRGTTEKRYRLVAKPMRRKRTHSE